MVRFRLSLSLGSAILFLACMHGYAASQPARAASNARTGTSSAQAGMVITLSVAPVVMAPPRQEQTGSSGVIFNLQGNGSRMEVTETLSPLPASANAHNNTGALLKTVTVVPR